MIFFYDGRCTFCSKLAAALKLRCQNKKIQFFSFRDFSESELKAFHRDLNYDLASGNIQFIQAGTRYPGFFAIRKLIPYLTGFRYFFWVLYLPLIPFIGMFILSVLKRFRH